MEPVSEHLARMRWRWLNFWSELCPRLKRSECATAGQKLQCPVFAWLVDSLEDQKLSNLPDATTDMLTVLLVKAGSGALTFGNPDSAGIPESFAQETIVLPYNDLDAVKSRLLSDRGRNCSNYC